MRFSWWYALHRNYSFAETTRAVHPRFVLAAAAVGGDVSRHCARVLNLADLMRLAQPTDRAAVTACVRQAYAPWVERIGREPAPMTADYARLIADGAVYVLRDPSAAEARGVLVLRRAESTLWIDNVAVAAAYQHSGVG